MVVVSNRVSSVTSTPGEIRILVPVEPTSFLYAGDFVTVSFPSIKGLRYTLETTDTLVPPAWVQSPGSIRRKGTGEILTLSDTTTGVPRRYYRLRVE